MHDADAAPVTDRLRIEAALGPRYRLRQELGAGGMATVYLADDLRHGRPVAVKVLRDAVARQLGASRFLHEIRIAANLSHPHILPVFDSAERDGVLYYVMPFVDGESLRHRLERESQMGIPDAIRVLRDVADALAYAHAHHVVHRDLKPDNVMLAGRHALVADFGVARALDHSSGAVQITTAGVALGTPAYMAPEQAAGDPNIDHRVDIYAFGVLAYEMLAGRLPFTGSPQAVMAAHVTRAPEPLSLHRPEAPVVLQDLVARCLAKDPRERWPSLDEVIGVLEAAVTPSSGLPTTGARAALPGTPSRPDPNSIAVLPFKNLSADPESEYFADGVSEEIINALNQIPDLRVAARTSCFAFKGQEQDVRIIGERLNVAAVVEGSVRHAGQRVRITAQLVSVANGYQLWSQRFDRDLKDIFAIQDEIATAIAGALTDRLTPRPIKIKRSNVEAYDLYLRGRFHWNKRTNPSMREAIALFNQALEKDPDYAPAHAGLADCYGLLGWVAFGALAPGDAFPLSEQAAAKALALDPSLAEAHNSLAWSRLVYRWNWPEAERHFQRALELNPRYAMGRSWYGLSLTWVNRLEDAFAETGLAMELDPLSLIIHTLAAWARYFAGDYQESVALYRRTLELDPEYIRAYLGLGWAHEQTGDLDAAIAAFQTGSRLSGPNPRYVAALGHAYAAAGRVGKAEEQLQLLEEMARTEFVSASYFASVHAGLNHSDLVFEWLDRAREERSGALAYLHVDPHFAHLRSDPRFLRLVGTVGIGASRAAAP